MTALTVARYALIIPSSTADRSLMSDGEAEEAMLSPMEGIYGRRSTAGIMVGSKDTSE